MLHISWEKKTVILRPQKKGKMDMKRRWDFIAKYNKLYHYLKSELMKRRQ